MNILRPYKARWLIATAVAAGVLSYLATPASAQYYPPVQAPAPFYPSPQPRYPSPTVVTPSPAAPMPPSYQSPPPPVVVTPPPFGNFSDPHRRF